MLKQNNEQMYNMGYSISIAFRHTYCKRGFEWLLNALQQAEAMWNPRIGKCITKLYHTIFYQESSFTIQGITKTMTSGIL